MLGNILKSINLGFYFWNYNGIDEAFKYFPPIPHNNAGRLLDSFFMSVFNTKLYIIYHLNFKIKTTSKETRLGLLYQTPLWSYPISLIPTTWSLSPSTVLFTKFRWGLFLSLFLLSLSLLLLLSQAKVESTPSPRPKTGQQEAQPQINFLGLWLNWN